eukprot:gene1460-1588_t
MVLSKSLILAEHVDEGIPQNHHFRVEEKEVNIEDLKASLTEESILVHLSVVSADPYLRGTIKNTGTIKPGHPMACYTAGIVLASKNPAWVEGDFIGANLPVISVQIVTAEMLARTRVWKLTGYVDNSNISYGIGILGSTGSTAYGGIEGILRPNPGETIFISAASGAVGGLAGMIAKHKYGCKVIGSAGGPEKCAFVKSFYGYDHCIDYKEVYSAEDLIAKVREVAPEGIDMYFENVGGIHFEAALKLLRPRGRIAICGQIAEYNKKDIPTYQLNTMGMIYTQQRIEGFVCGEWLTGQKGNFHADMSAWLKEGKVRAQETVFHGLQAWPEAFQSLFTGKSLGKVVVFI